MQTLHRVIHIILSSAAIQTSHLHLGGSVGADKHLVGIKVSMMPVGARFTPRVDPVHSFDVEIEVYALLNYMDGRSSHNWPELMKSN